MSKDCATGSIRDAVCIHTDKVYDACKDKDCSRLLIRQKAGKEA